MENIQIVQISAMVELEQNLQFYRRNSIVKEISFEYMSVEDPETYNSTVFPCWRFCIATTATLEQYGEYENDIIINAVTGEFYAVTNRYE